MQPAGFKDDGSISSNSSRSVTISVDSYAYDREDQMILRKFDKAVFKETFLFPKAPAGVNKNKNKIWNEKDYQRYAAISGKRLKGVLTFGVVTIEEKTKITIIKFFEDLCIYS